MAPLPSITHVLGVDDNRARLDGSLGYAGLDIRLPALQRYEAEANGPAELLTPITEHLYNAMNRPHGPNKVRQQSVAQAV